MVINDLDFDVEEPTLEDFPDETKEIGNYIIAQSQLCRICMSQAIQPLRTRFVTDIFSSVGSVL